MLQKRKTGSKPKADDTVPAETGRQSKKVRFSTNLTSTYGDDDDNDKDDNHNNNNGSSSSTTAVAVTDSSKQENAKESTVADLGVHNIAVELPVDTRDTASASTAHAPLDAEQSTGSTSLVPTTAEGSSSSKAAYQPTTPIYQPTVPTYQPTAPTYQPTTPPLFDRFGYSRTSPSYRGYEEDSQGSSSSSSKPRANPKPQMTNSDGGASSSSSSTSLEPSGNDNQEQDTNLPTPQYEPTRPVYQPTAPVWTGPSYPVVSPSVNSEPLAYTPSAYPPSVSRWNAYSYEPPSPYYSVSPAKPAAKAEGSKTGVAAAVGRGTGGAGSSTAPNFGKGTSRSANRRGKQPQPFCPLPGGYIPKSPVYIDPLKRSKPLYKIPDARIKRGKGKEKKVTEEEQVSIAEKEDLEMKQTKQEEAAAALLKLLTEAFLFPDQASVSESSLSSCGGGGSSSSSISSVAGSGGSGIVIEVAEIMVLRTLPKHVYHLIPNWVERIREKANKEVLKKLETNLRFLNHQGDVLRNHNQAIKDVSQAYYKAKFGNGQVREFQYQVRRTERSLREAKTRLEQDGSISKQVEMKRLEQVELMEKAVLAKKKKLENAVQVHENMVNALTRAENREKKALENAKASVQALSVLKALCVDLDIVKAKEEKETKGKEVKEE